MLEKIKYEYKKFQDNTCQRQKDIGVLKLKYLSIISGITCIGKNHIIKYHNLPSLYSYKTGEEKLSTQEKQIYYKPKKFLSKMSEGCFFDLYSINNKFYAYSLEDYFLMQKEFGEVYIDISIESIYNGLKYQVGKIFILDYTEEQLEKNIKKRIQERAYPKERIIRLKKIILQEKEMIKIIKTRRNNNIYFLKNINEIEKYI